MKALWTKERRENQRQKIKEWKPWEASTGPKTEAGKAKVAQNSYKHGMQSAEMVQLSKTLSTMRKRHKKAIENLQVSR